MAEIISANKAKISLRGSIENKSPLQIAKETTELLQSESRFDQAGKKFSTLTDVAIKSATSKTPLTPSPFMKNSPNGMVPSRINERQSTAFPPMPSTTSSRIATSWWSNIGSEPKENIVTPGLASYVNQQRSNKRSKVQYREDTKAGTPSQHPPPPSTGEHRTSFFGILNCSGVFGTANKGCTKPSNTASGTTTTSEVAHLPTFQRGLSRGLSSMFGLSVEKTQNDRFQDDGEPAPPPSFQRRLSRGISSMFGLSLDKAQTDRFQDTTPLPNFQRGISRGLSRGISGMFGFSRQPIANSQAQDNGQTSHRTNDSSNDNFALPPPPTRQLTTQVSAWLTSFHPTETTELETMSSSKAENAKRYNNNDPVLSRGISSSIYGEPLPPPVGSSETGVSDNPSLARSISSAVYGLRDSPSLLLTSLKSGVSSMFWNLDDTTLKKAVNQPSSEKDGVNGNATLGKGIESRGCLLDDTEDTPMEMQLRDGGNSRTLDKKLANEKRGCLLDDLDDNELQQQLRLAI